ncbi:CooT family nickel-binding protein [Thermodesulfobacteriota bacterium]
MCESNAFLVKDGQEDILLESVDMFESDGDLIKLQNIFGEEKKIRGRIKSISLIDHKIFIEPLD